MSARTAAAAALVLLFGEGIAHAGRSHFGWLFDTETVPERGVELEQWITDEHQQGPTHEAETSIWWAPVVGITDQLELAVPIEWEWTRSDVETPRTFLARYGGELRWRLVTADPVEAPMFEPVIRVAVKKPVIEKEAAQIEGDAILGFTYCDFHAVVNAGFYDDIHRGADVASSHAGLGVSYAITDELRLGAEAYGERHLAGRDAADDWATVGPNLSWTHGRFWLSASFGVGVYQIQSAPRIKWAVAF